MRATLNRPIAGVAAVIVTAMLLGLGVSAQRALSAQSAQPNADRQATAAERASKSVNDWQTTVVDQTTGAASDLQSLTEVERRTRLAREAYSDRHFPQPSMPSDGETMGTGGAMVGDSMRPTPELPVHDTDITVVATLGRFQPVLTTSQRSMFTELYFSIEEVLKNRPDMPLAPGQLVTSIMPGGSIRRSDGKVVRATATLDLTLSLGGRYVLFMNYDAKTDSYFVLKAWGLKDQSVVPANREDIARARMGTSRFAGGHETDLKAEIRQALESVQAK